MRNNSAAGATDTISPWLGHCLSWRCGCANSALGLIPMRNSITVMNAKGGVGKSTLVLTLAETLAAHHDKKILVIDSDAHASISTMLMSPNWLSTIQGQGRTFVDYLIAVVLNAA